MDAGDYQVSDGSRRSLYEVLGVAPEAPQEAIVHAYRQRARALHPDARPDDPAAAARFRILAGAYEVLRDPARRADYDAVRPDRSAAGRQPGPGHPRSVGDRVSDRNPTGGNSPAVFLGVRPPRIPGAQLGVGPVRMEDAGRATLGDGGGGGGASLDRGTLESLLALLVEEWSE